MDARQNAKNCEELAIEAQGPTRKRFTRLAEGWRDVANAQDWLDPRQKTDAPNTKQTDEPWKGNPEKEQRNDGDIDLEKWQESNTHRRICRGSDPRPQTYDVADLHGENQKG